MKIVMLTQTYPRYAGDTAGTFIQSIAHALAAQGDEVHVILPWDRALRYPQPADAAVALHPFRYAPSDRLHVLGYSQTMAADVGLKPLAYLLAPAMAVGAGLALRRLVRAVKPDVVNAHWLVPNGVVAAALHCHPMVVSLHGSDVFMAERRLFRPAAAFALKRTDALTGSSQDLVDRALAIRPTPRARFIPYGVDPAHFSGQDPRAKALRKQLEVEDDETLILAVGRVVPKKGFDVLLEALGRLGGEGWTAVIAGEGASLTALRAQAAKLGIAPRVRFPGGIAHDDLPAYYGAADIFVMPSVRDFAGNVDGLPNVVLEAMSSGRAVVASAIGGIPAVIEDGVHGSLVPEGDAEKLTRALERLLADADLRRTMGARARQKVLSELTWPEVARRYRQAYVDAGAPP